jgi:3-hydroxyacyl-[acyl-carrier-protein] dehydratase
MLQNDFFYFTPLQADGSLVTTTIEFNAGHAIFDGHFPGNPVVPGVCMLQIIKEITVQLAGGKIRLLKASDIKFLAVINPNENKSVPLEITSLPEGNHIRIEAVIKKDELVFFKFKGVFVKL